MRIVSIIVPAYNEEATVVKLLERVRDQKISGINFEILVIDDGSTDRTVELLEQRTDLYTHFVKLKSNRGKGATVLEGLGKASGEFILFQDADLEYDPADYGKLLEPVIRFSADLVMGSRLVASPITRVSYFWHRVGNRIITPIFNILNNTTFTDIYSCYILYRRELVDINQLKTSGWEQQAEILTLAVAKANPICEVPINYYGRSYDEGKKIKAQHIFAVIWTMFVKRLFR